MLSVRFSCYILDIMLKPPPEVLPLQPRLTTYPEVSHEIDIDDGGYLLVGDVEEATRLYDACVVHQDVHGSRFLFQDLGQRRDGSAVCHVQAQAARVLCCVLRHLRYQTPRLLTLRLHHVDARHATALAREVQRQLAAQCSTRSRDLQPTQTDQTCLLVVHACT